MKKQVKQLIRKFQTIRWRLPLSYAGIALLTTLVLGGVLLFGLNDFYNDREQEYLEQNAVALRPFLEALWTEEANLAELDPVLAQFSFFSDTRLRLLDINKMELVDTGYQVSRRQFTVNLAQPYLESQAFIGPLPAEAFPRHAENIRDLVNPPIIFEGVTSDTNLVSFFTVDSINGENTGFVAAGGGIVAARGSDKPHPDRPPETLWQVADQTVLVGQRFPFFIERRAYGGYSFDSEQDIKDKDIPHSDQNYLMPIRDENEQLLGYLELSGGPALGTTILANVQNSLLWAGLIAVLLAASVGWMGSRNLSHSLQIMAQATEQMAEGDHSTRVNLQRHDELGTLARSFNNMAERVEVTIATLQRFVADAAHEIQTPITAIQTNLELAEGDAVTYAYYVEQAHRQLERLSHLTQNLLNLARIESHELNLNVQPMDLGALLRQLSESYASRAEQADMAFALDLPDVAVWIQGDESQLARVADNLLDNALKFTPANGQVIVKLEATGDHIRLSIVDTGIGIPADDQPYLFNRFRRGRNAMQYPGSGLGLVLAKTIIEAHEGKINFTSDANGTRFMVQLPRGAIEDETA